jgi:predicted kinase
VFGFLGSGKTTLAKRLELQHSAVRFTPDEWMARLFGEDPPADRFQAFGFELNGIAYELQSRT